MEFRAGSEPWMDSVSILICQRDYSTNKIGQIAKPLQIEMQSHEPGSYISEPTMRLNAQEALGLMNALWDAGVRPSEFKSPNGEINRLEAHLSDMRRLVFDVSNAAKGKE